MITMEFDELQKVWDKQNNEPLYVINEEALHRRIKAKKRAAAKKANWMEIILIGANLLAGSMLLWAVLFKGKEHETFIYVMIPIMLLVPFYLLYKRTQRKKSENKFEHTLLGDIEHALSNASYTVTLSRTSQLYFLSIAALTMLSLIFDKDASIASIIGISILFLLTLYASRWEHNFYVRKKKELQNLKEKMGEETEA
jgi:L-asparagine transporter-like permease